MTFEEYLNVCRMKEDSYIMALRSSIVRDEIFLKRHSSETRVNGYNPTILHTWKANTDLQFILDPWAVCFYIASYLMKSQRGISRLLQKAADEAKKGNYSVKQKLQIVGNKFLNHCEISAQEAIYILLQMPLTQSARTVTFLNTSEPEKRIRILKPSKILKALPKDSTDILCDGILQHYATRPTQLEHLTLADFASQYDIRCYKGQNNVEIIDNTDNTVEEIESQQHIKLDDNKYLAKRAKPKILRTVRYNIKQKEENYLREQLMLYPPGGMSKILWEIHLLSKNNFRIILKIYLTKEHRMKR